MAEAIVHVDIPAAEEPAPPSASLQKRYLYTVLVTAASSGRRRVLGHRAAYRQRLRLCSGAEHPRPRRLSPNRPSRAAAARGIGSCRLLPAYRRRSGRRGHLIVGSARRVAFPGELGRRSRRRRAMMAAVTTGRYGRSVSGERTTVAAGLQPPLRTLSRTGRVVRRQPCGHVSRVFEIAGVQDGVLGRACAREKRVLYYNACRPTNARRRVRAAFQAERSGLSA